jgi:phosphoglycerate dehydrogenase-like enzyme
MKPGAYLLNGSRGQVVDQAALEEALGAGRFAGVWLDVTDPEPLPIDSPLWHHPRVLITPHCVDQVADFPLHYARLFVENFHRYLKGVLLENLVQPRV